MGIFCGIFGGFHGFFDFEPYTSGQSGHSVVLIWCSDIVSMWENWTSLQQQQTTLVDFEKVGHSPHTHTHTGMRTTTAPLEKTFGQPQRCIGWVPTKGAPEGTGEQPMRNIARKSEDNNNLCSIFFIGSIIQSRK